MSLTPERFSASRLDVPQPGPELGEDLLDRVEIRAARLNEQQARAVLTRIFYRSCAAPICGSCRGDGSAVRSEGHRPPRSFESSKEQLSTHRRGISFHADSQRSFLLEVSALGSAAPLSKPRGAHASAIRVNGAVKPLVEHKKQWYYPIQPKD